MSVLRAALVLLLLSARAAAAAALVPSQGFDALFAAGAPGQLEPLTGKRALVTGASSGIGKARGSASGRVSRDSGAGDAGR